MHRAAQPPEGKNDGSDLLASVQLGIAMDGFLLPFAIRARTNFPALLTAAMSAFPTKLSATRAVDWAWRRCR